MSKFKSFQEYLSHNKKLQTTPKVAKIADYDGPTASSPPKAEKPKDAGGAKTGGGGKPYGPANKAKKGSKKAEKGFADEGHKDLVYNPDISAKGDVASGGQKVGKDWPKTKTQEWLEKTKGLSLSEFTKAIKEKSLTECNCSGAMDGIKEVVENAKSSPLVIAHLVREVKRAGLLGDIINEMMDHQETYDAMVARMEDDEEGDRCSRRLVRAMNELYARLNEMVAPPAHHDEEEEDEDEPDGPPDNVQGEEFPPGEDDDDMDMGDEEDPDMGGDDDMGDDPDAMGDDPDADMGDDPDAMGPDMGADSPHGGSVLPNPHLRKKKKFPHHHMINAMKDHPPMAAAMKDALNMGGNDAGM